MINSVLTSIKTNCTGKAVLWLLISLSLIYFYKELNGVSNGIRQIAMMRKVIKGEPDSVFNNFYSGEWVIDNEHIDFEESTGKFEISFILEEEVSLKIKFNDGKYNDNVLLVTTSVKREKILQFIDIPVDLERLSTFRLAVYP